MRNRWLGLVLVGVALVISSWTWSTLPAEVRLPWQSASRSMVKREVAALFLPGVMLSVWLVLGVFPRIDPRRANYARFADTYWLLGNAVLLTLLAAHGMLVSGIEPIDRLIVAAAGVLVTLLGNYLGRVEPNWFFGIRTPWTLESDVVWRRTHRTMGRVLFVAGLLLVAFAPMVTLPAAPVLGALAAMTAALAMVVSWIYWRSESGSGSGSGG